MTEKKTVLVEYIGNRKYREDDVLKTDRVWDRPGAVLAIPAEQAPLYLRHKCDWRETTQAEQAIREAAAISPEHLLPLSLAQLHELAAMVDARIAQIESGASDPVPVAATPSAPLTLGDVRIDPTADDATATLAADRAVKIAAVIKEMDPKNDEEWSNRGPRVNVVSERVGFKVSSDEVNAAISLLNAGG